MISLWNIIVREKQLLRDDERASVLLKLLKNTKICCNLIFLVKKIIFSSHERKKCEFTSYHADLIFKYTIEKLYKNKGISIPSAC